MKTIISVYWCDMNKIKDEILEEMLKEAVFGGWNDASLKKSVKNAGHQPEYAEILFPGGISEIAEYFISKADAEMEKLYKKQDVSKLKIREKIASAVIIRLQIYEKNKEAIRKLLGFFALPQNMPLAIKTLGGTASKIWYLAGDNATDYNYYTKRILLSGVYSSTLIYWLNDDSENFINTKEFLMRRIEDVMKIQKLRGKADEFLAKFKKAV